jgi:hypothetical protein
VPTRGRSHAIVPGRSHATSLRDRACAVPPAGTCACRNSQRAPNTRERRELVHRQSYIDIVTFDAGPALIQIVALRQRRPFRVAAERRALALLYARARAHQI